MAQHDYVLENQSGALFRQDLNNALSAIATNNMAATAPTTTYAGMFWLDTSTSPATLRIRNNTNSAWISCGNLNEMSYLAGVTSSIQAQINAKLTESSYTAADVLTKIKTVDGAGSGLDADLLRGLPADFTSSLGQNGWQKLPSGLIIQWGIIGPISTDQGIGKIYSIAFPTTVASIVAVYDGTGDLWAKVMYVDKNGFEAVCEYSGAGAKGSGHIRFVAIGY